MHISYRIEGEGFKAKSISEVELTDEELNLHSVDEWKDIVGAAISEIEQTAIKETIKRIDHDMLHGGIYDGPIDNVPATEVFGNDFDPSKIGGII